MVMKTDMRPSIPTKTIALPAMSKKGFDIARSGFGLLFVLALLLSAACAPRPSIERAKILLDEIASAESPSDERVLANNWEAFDVLGAALREDPDSAECYGAFSTFLLATSDLDMALFTDPAIKTMIEYAGNLLVSVPPRGILLVADYEGYYLARYSQAIEGRGRDVAVVLIDLLRFGKYRRELTSRYGIFIPKDVAKKLSSDSNRKLLTDDSVNWFISSSGRPIYLDMSFPAYGGKPSYLLGPGRLYGEKISEDEYKRLVLGLYSDLYSFEEANKNWEKLPERVNSMVQTFSDGLPYTIAHWLSQGDTTAAESLATVAVERLPHRWRAIEIFLKLHPELPEKEKAKLIGRVAEYVRAYPNDRSAAKALDKMQSANKVTVVR